MNAAARRQQPQYSFPSTGNHVPEDKDQRLVQTPYGRGLVIRTREPLFPDLTAFKTSARKPPLPMQEVQLLDWTRKTPEHETAAPLRPAMLYSAADLISFAPAVGDDVLTLYGRGRVIELRPADNMVVVLISSWRLAGRSRVTCYLSTASVVPASATKSLLQVVRPKKLYEMSVHEKVEQSATFKAAAARQFAQKDYAGALELYSRAVDAVRYVQHNTAELTNHVRADLIVTMITCGNNAGTCCTQLQRWDEAERFAQQAEVLIDALQQKGPSSKIRAVLNRDGFSDIQLFGEWRVKSYLLMARASTERGEFEQASGVLKKAHEVIVQYTATSTATTSSSSSVSKLLANAKEVKKLNAICKEQRKAHLKKEKQRARAMFGGGNVQEDKDNEKSKSDLHSAAKTPVTPKDGSITAPTTPSKEDGTTVTTTKAATSSTESNKLKKRVSFSKEVMEKAVSQDDDEVEWYQDPEVLTGLAIFAGTCAATIIGISYLLSKKR